jgi:Zn ribbon nucleic-acid-binding protein
MNKILISGVILLLLGWFNAMTVLAQEEGQLTLSVSRDFGYSSGTGRIQGRFTMKARGPEDLVKVAFWIDDQVIGEDSEPPFSTQFHTDNFALGVHTLKATGYTAGGLEMNSNEYRQEFVQAQEGFQTALKIILPILGVTFAAILLGFLFPMLGGRKPRTALPLGAPRNYFLGGAICPKCRRPFGVHIWGLNLLVGKFDRCPHCGRWSLVRGAPREVLKAAEAAEIEIASGANEGASPFLSEEHQRKDLDDSRYTDL